METEGERVTILSCFKTHIYRFDGFATRRAAKTAAQINKSKHNEDDDDDENDDMMTTMVMEQSDMEYCMDATDPKKSRRRRACTMWIPCYYFRFVCASAAATTI
jgi:hypothetical protein